MKSINLASLCVFSFAMIAGALPALADQKYALYVYKQGHTENGGRDGYSSEALIINGNGDIQLCVGQITLANNFTTTLSAAAGCHAITFKGGQEAHGKAFEYYHSAPQPMNSTEGYFWRIDDETGEIAFCIVSPGGYETLSQCGIGTLK